MNQYPVFIEDGVPIEMSDKQPVDYNDLAASYDQRYQSNPLEGVGHALGCVIREVMPRRVLEVGCGTGRWLADLAEKTDFLMGLDPYLEMLFMTRAKTSHPRLVCAKGTMLPLAAESLDLIFCVNALHHTESPEQFLLESRRVLMKGGWLVLVGMDPHRSDNYWYVYDYFDDTLTTDRSRYPSWPTVSEWLRSIGFESPEFRDVERIRQHWQGEDVWHDPFLDKNSCSQLAVLTEAEYARGRERIRSAIQTAECQNTPVTFSTRLTLTMLLARLG